MARWLIVRKMVGDSLGKSRGSLQVVIGLRKSGAVVEGELVIPTLQRSVWVMSLLLERIPL